MLKKLWAILVVAIGLFMFASNALASNATVSHSQAVSLYRPFPEGIDSTNARRALAQVMDRASWDSQYGKTIAQQTGTSSFDPAQYATLGYSAHAPAGTTNSGLTASGTVVPIADHGGSQHVKVLLVMNIVTKQTVALMVRCGNPRLHPFVKVLPWKPFSKGTLISVNRSVSRPVSLTCPSGQKVSGTITATIKGTIRAKTWGKVQGNLNLQLQQKVNLQVKAFADLKCGPAPPSPTPTVNCPAGTIKDSNNNCVAVVVSCPSGTFKDANGNCVAQTNTAEQNCKAMGGTWNGSNQLCTIIQVNGNCSNIVVVNGSGNTVSTSQQGNCNNNAPPTSNFTATATATASATATATANCPSGSASATASATATASGSGSGSATSTVSQQDAQNKAQAIANANAQAAANANAQAQATASASAKCTPAPPPVTHFTQVACQLPEHIIVGDSAFMYCVTTNDNGALISLNVKGDNLATVSNQVSVNQRNQAGDPCPSGAQCFRETILAGSTTGTSHITATASSNGTPGNWDGYVPIAPDTGFTP